MSNLIQDLRHAARLLARSPAFTFVAVITLALGIGANTAIFSVVNSVLLAPLPYEDGDRLVQAVRKQSTQLGTIASYPDFVDWRDSGAFSQTSPIVGRAFFLEGADGPQRVVGGRVSAEFLPMLGVSPVLGRNFSAEEEARGENVAILTHRFWTEHFAQAPQVIGKELKLGAQSVTGQQLYRVVGVLPENFRDPTTPVSGRDLYVPLVVSADERNSRNSQWLQVLGRIAPGKTLEQARTVVESLSQRAIDQTKDVRKMSPFTVVTLRERQVGDAQRALWLLLGAVGFVLLIACANVSNLLLARTNARGHEMAVRAAVGATRGRLLSQLLTESLLLSAMGGALALVLLLWGIEAIKTISPVQVPRLAEAGVSVPVFAFAVGVSAICGLLFGALPAMRGARQDVNLALKSTRTSAGIPQRRAFAALLVGEVALTIVLLAGAGLALQSLSRLMSVDPVFEKGSVLTVNTQFIGEVPAAQQRIFYQQLVERVRAMPGVRAAGVVDNVPLSGSWSQYTTTRQSFLERFPAERADERIEYEMTVVTGDYFRALGIPLRAGRVMNTMPGENSPAEVMVSEDLASILWGSENPVGQRVNISGAQRDLAEVVGVVGSVRHRGLDVQPVPTMYAQLSRRGSWGGTLLVRSDENLDPLVAAVRQTMRDLDRSVVAGQVRTLDDLLKSRTASQRFLAVLLGSFAALALVLAVVGIYGVLAYSVSQQTREIGIRLALGAEPGGVLRLVVRNGMALVSVGVVIGVAAAAGLSRYIQSMLFEVSPTDPRTFVAVSALLLVVSAIACYLPARRAARVDPMVSLRYE